MTSFEKDLKSHPADYVLVVGDVTSSMACGIVANKCHVPLIHVEAGLRSSSRKMPEEINRIVIDSITDIFFTTTKDASEILLKEGKETEQIHLAGNVMINSLQHALPKLREPVGIDLNQKYFVLTLHSPYNVDEKQKLESLLNQISQDIGKKAIGIFPVHPRTLKSLNLQKIPNNIVTTSPMGYLEVICLLKQSTAVITDSGGIQEETTVLGIPCLTLRDNTERPETATIGTNELIGTSNLEGLSTAIQTIMNGNWKKGGIPDLWDGASSERIAKILLDIVNR